MTANAASASFPVLDVSEWPVTALEPGGSDEKVWLRSPGTGLDALFKANRPRDNAEQGEDWPEKLVSELAAALGVPAAPIDLAEYAGRSGCVSYNVVPDGWELQPGAVLLNRLLGFQHDPSDRAARGHTLQNVQQVLLGYGVPPGFTGAATFDAFSVFAGYLVLDALIGNRDRHSENWAVLLDLTGSGRVLAPSYDHASALGFNLTDHRRGLLFRDPNMLGAFMRKGTAYRFEGCNKVTLVDLAHSALALAGSTARDYWLGCVDSIDDVDFGRLVEQVPVMSDPARRFAVDLLAANRRRLLHA